MMAMIQMFRIIHYKLLPKTVKKYFKWEWIKLASALAKSC